MNKSTLDQAFNALFGPVDNCNAGMNIRLRKDYTIEVEARDHVGNTVTFGMNVEAWGDALDHMQTQFKEEILPLVLKQNRAHLVGSSVSDLADELRKRGFNVSLTPPDDGASDEQRND